LQVDLLKAIAIVSVILIHTVSSAVLTNRWAAFHFWQAVPVFVVLMGLNATQSAQRRGVHWRRYYSTRLRRLRPVGIVALLAVVGGLLNGRGDFRLLNLAGWLPLYGPGNYYVVLAVEFVLLFPLIWWFFRRWPGWTVAALCTIELAYHLAIQASGVLDGPHAQDAGFIYASTMLHWLGAIALGMWIAADPRISARRNIWVLVAAAGSIAYLWVFCESGGQTTVLPVHQTLMAFPYAALLVMLGIRFLPATARGPLGPAVRGAAAVGQASLHIFLVQMLYFSPLVRTLPPENEWKHVVVKNMVFCLVVGTLWWWVDTRSGAWRRVKALLRPRDVRPVPERAEG
jgi:peptidoglycan/LPS O-acetylase OafA/YrhL